MTSCPASEASSAISERRLSIIVADDVEEIRTMIGGWLSDLGHDVICVATGSEVLRQLQRRTFDLIITDVLMPDGDGLDVITAVRRAGEPRVLAISGGGRYMVAADCLRIAKGVGAQEVLLKPFKRETLLAAIDRTMQG